MVFPAALHAESWVLDRIILMKFFPGMKMNFFNSKTVPVLKSHDVWLGCVCIEIQNIN